MAIVWAVGLAFLAMGLFNVRPSLQGRTRSPVPSSSPGGLIARAVADHAAAARPAAKASFVPEDVLADALDTRDD